MGESGLSDVERPKLGNDLYKHPLRTQMVAMDPESGLPRVVSAVSMEDSKAPPLEPETFVCMGDESAFVIRDEWGDVLLSVEPARVRRYTTFTSVGDEIQGWLAPLTSEQRDQAGCPTAVRGGADLWYWVEPLRPQCEHYKRVMTDFEGSDENKRVERVCTAQRTEGGEYIALGDTRVYACEHRTPRDFVSEQRLRQFDAEVVSRGKKTVKYWDGEAALEAALRTAEEEEQNG
jgi:hypothetical protein